MCRMVHDILTLCIAMLQIDEFLETGTMSALEEEGGVQKATAEGGGGAKRSGDQAMALKFL